MRKLIILIRLFAVSLSPVFCLSQPSNYVREWTAKAPETDANVLVTRSSADVEVSTMYFDGLGRPLQSVVKKGSLVTSNSSTFDLVVPFEYDANGRETKKYIPYVAATNDGLYKDNAITSQELFYNSTASPVYGQAENTFYSKINYELSPLSRPLKQMAPGANWAGSERGVSTGYWSNTLTDGVRIWKTSDFSGDFVSYSTQADLSGLYPAGSIYKTITVDEMGHAVIEFKDLDGKVLLKKVQANALAVDDGTGSNYNNWVSTLYIYDELDRLSCVVQPEGVKTLVQNGWIFTAALLKEQCFRYKYDIRGRIVKKQVPGAAPISMVYDSRDRLVFSQDGNMAVRNQWLTTLYDRFNRQVVTGMITYSGSPADLQNLVDANDPAQPSVLSIQNSSASAATNLTFSVRESGRILYEASNSIVFLPGFETEQAANVVAQIVPNPSGSPALSTEMEIVGNPIPSGVSFHALTQTFYDNYTKTQKNYDPSDNALLTTSSGNMSFAESLPPSKSVNTLGMVTSSKVWAMRSAVDLTQGEWMETASFYDDRGRMIQTVRDHLGGGMDRITNRYGFAGQPVVSYDVHDMLQSGEKIYVKTSYEYDILSRIVRLKKKINSDVEKTILYNEYDAIGQLRQKTLGENGADHVEELTYDYNIRGWTLGMNRGYVGGIASQSTRYFGFDLGYDKASDAVTVASYTPQFSGNISGTIWKSKGDGVQRKYDFSYDALDRFSKADFTQSVNGGGWSNLEMDFSVGGNSLNSGISYDDNGNIKEMGQKGWTLYDHRGYIDQLTYQYFPGSNRLKQVSDVQAKASTMLGDFNYSFSKTATAIDYGYDVNGNMVSDHNKAIERTNVNINSDGLQTSGQGITYNHLNLPAEIKVDGKGTISYVYDATGNKLQKKVEDKIGGQATMTTTTDYVGSFVYESINDGTPELQFFSHEEGKARAVRNVQNQITSFALDYFVKDHLGNVRMVLTDESQVLKYPIASLETSKIDVEKLYYTIVPAQVADAAQINGLPAIRPNDNGMGNTPSDVTFEQGTSQKLYKLNKNSVKTGLGITLKVMAGDKIDIYGKSWSGSSNTDQNAAPTITQILTDMLDAGGQVIRSGHDNITAQGIEQTPNATTAISTLLNGQASGANTTANAFINYIFFDEQFKAVGASSSKVDEPNQTSFKDHHPDLSNLLVPQNGYVYVYCSNASPVDVFFDNVQIIHTKGPILEETHYYPFGMIMAGISTKATQIKGIYEKFQGQEFSTAEFTDGSGLELYAFKYRTHDPQLGRFMQIDPLASDYVYNSAYAFSENHVTTHIELEGLEKIAINPPNPFKPPVSVVNTPLKTQTKTTTPNPRGFQVTVVVTGGLSFGAAAKIDDTPFQGGFTVSAKEVDLGGIRDNEAVSLGHEISGDKTNVSRGEISVNVGGFGGSLNMEESTSKTTGDKTTIKSGSLSTPLASVETTRTNNSESKIVPSVGASAKVAVLIGVEASIKYYGYGNSANARPYLYNQPKDNTSLRIPNLPPQTKR